MNKRAKTSVILSGLQVLLGFCAASIPVASYADTVIKTSPANTGSYVLKDNGLITVDANITQTKTDGSGGLIDLEAGTVLTINKGRMLDVSAVLSGKSGGTINLKAPAVIINGILKANGKGNGSGGTINLFGLGGVEQKGIYLGDTAVLEARSGEVGGLGGLINIYGTGGSPVTVAPNARLETSGMKGDNANAIYIHGDGALEVAGKQIGLDIGGQVIANNPSGQGGVIRFTSQNGGVWVRPEADIQANGGRVEIAAETSDSNTGVLHQGTINVSGIEASPNGGTIQMTGKNIIQDGQVLADGANQGQGGYIGIVSEQNTVLTENSLTSARGAGEHSDAGEIFVWSDGDTYFNEGGVIDVSGGSISGDGGFAEVSGVDNVYFNGQAFGGANDGEGGTIFIDPANITISNVGPFDNPLKDSWFSADAAYNDGGGSSAVFDPRANGTFDGFSGIWLQATNNITIASDFDTAIATGNNGVSLRLEARNDILINANLATGNANITLTADSNNNNSGAIIMDTSKSISSRGGDITLSGYGMTLGTVDSSRSGSDGDISINSRNGFSAISVDSETGDTSITVTGGNLTTTNGVTSAATALSATGYIDTAVNTTGNLNAYADGQNGSGISIDLSGSVGGNLIARNRSSGNTVGDIIMGDWETATALNVTGTTTFLSSQDALMYGSFTGAVTGTAGRVSVWQTGTTNFRAESITATGSTELWTGYGNTLNIYAPNASIIEDNDGSVDLTASNGGITLWAGVDSSETTSYIEAGISSTGDVYLWAAGDTNGASAGGTSINVETGSIGGSIVAVDETWDRTTGNISITLSSGNLTTKEIGSGRNVTLSANGGSILQNNAYGFDRDVTIYATGNVTLNAGNSGADSSSAIGSLAAPVGVYAEGNATLRASGRNGQNDSVVVVGQIDGDTVVQDESSTAVSGDVYLGTTVGDPDLLNDSDGVLDTYGDVTVNALGDVFLNGGVALNGSLTVTGNRVTIRQDMGDTNIASITTTAASGNGVDILNYSNQGIFGDGFGVDILTAIGSSILLQAGDGEPNAYINNLNVNSGNNLTVIVSGDSNGTSPGGVSVNISGSAVGSSTATDELGGVPSGSVSMP